MSEPQRFRAELRSAGDSGGAGFDVPLEFAAAVSDAHQAASDAPKAAAKAPIEERAVPKRMGEEERRRAAEQLKK